MKVFTFFFQAEDGIRDGHVTGVQTCALPIFSFHDSDWRRLAEPVLATNDVPSFDKSPYDGFALRAEDTKGASPENPVRLKVIEHIGAGVLPEKDISSGETTRIMTGAQIPEGANCVEMFEKVKETKEDGETYIVITHEMESG